MAALATTAAATGVSLYEGNQQAHLQEKAINDQEAQNNLRAAQQQRDLIRQARVAYGSAQQNAENQGSANSSASQGGLGSIQSQIGEQVSFLDQYQQLGNAATGDLLGARRDQVIGQDAQGVASIANTVTGNAGRISKFFGG